MILADTSVWIDHFRTGDRELSEQLNAGQILIHPFVIAELALGFLAKRDQTLALLDLLPQTRVAQMNEVRSMIETQRLFGRGLGLVDASLIASVLITDGTLLWTRDQQLRKLGQQLGVHAGLA